MEIRIDFDELDDWQRWATAQPRLVRKATGTLLNDFAFGVRFRAFRQIEATMEVRAPKFTKGRLRVQKARPSAPTNRQKSVVGSIKTPKTPKNGAHSGWVEQETGQRHDRDHLPLLRSRNNIFSKKVRPITRLKPDRELIEAEHPDYRVRGGRTNVQGFLAMARRRKENRLIRVGKVALKRKKNKFETVQSLKRPKQPKLQPWMAPAIERYFRRAPAQVSWNRIAQRVLTTP